MQTLTLTFALLASATPSIAIPIDGTNITSALSLGARDDYFKGKVDFYSRFECTNPCVKDPGWCEGDDETKGDLNNPDHLGAGPWESANGDVTCWNVPAGTHAIGLWTDDGIGYVGSSLTCETLRKAADGHNELYNGAKPFVLSSGEGPARCNKKVPEGLTSVSYDWVGKTNS